MKREFVASSELDAPLEALFRWHCRPESFERLLPPWRRVEVTARTGGVESGSRLELCMWVGPVPIRWVAEHREFVRGVQFKDVQIRGPFAHWEHTHSFRAEPGGRSLLEDRVEYELPLGALGERLLGRRIREELKRLFEWRHRVTIQDLRLFGRVASDKAMKIAVSGSTGLLGEALVSFLTAGGHKVVRLRRKSSKESSPSSDDLSWDPSSSRIESDGLEGLDAVVHLAGENIATRRWSSAQKRKIKESRERGSRLLSETLANLKRPPKVLVSASAIGFYGDRGEEWLTEESGRGGGFLAEVCEEWEKATDPARQRGLRVVNLRLGMILSARGGALRKMLTPFKLGLGGVIGGGRQWMSWISLDDAVGVVHHVLNDARITGPVNAVSPSPVTNAQFTRALGKVLRRPTILPMPALAARMVLGEMANELLLSSQRVRPARLEQRAYPFIHTDLESALRHLLGLH